MALGGGSFTTQNKVLPGTYINFISAASANTQLSERGIVTMPLEMDWGPEDEVFEVTNEDFQKYSMKIFGYQYTHEKLKGLRDLFLNASTLYAYRLNGDGTKASNDFATAVYAGTRGNDIKILIQANADNEEMFDVITIVDTLKTDSQTVSNASELVDNDYVKFKTDASLTVTAAAPLTGGTNGNVTGESYQKYLELIESFTYNIMGVVTTDDIIKKLFIAFNKRMRDEAGIKFQLVLHNIDADYMGVINVKNETVDEKYSKAALVYWVSGAEAGCEVNSSCQNKIYDGEFTVNTKYSQTELARSIKAGEFLLHKVNSDVRVLEDINSMVTVTDSCGDVFKDNQTIRVIDQLGNDIAVLFNTKYLGAVPNDAAGRVSLWSDIVAYHRELEKIRAIENFSEEDVKVEQGENRKSVVISDNVTVVNAMGTLYMTITVS